MASERCLLDTHVLLWAVADPRRLSDETRRVIAEKRYVVSVASLWELIDKRDKRDAPVRDPASWWDDYVVKARTAVLPITSAHLLYLDRMRCDLHDPIDRILVAQSAVEKLRLITADARLREYAADTIPACD
jgi:PIN domain nuclease of toxin-antitoxin system